MLTKIQKWGNSLSLQIPKAFANDMRLDNDSLVEITLDKGRIFITPVSTPDLTLEELLAGVNKDDIHHEVDTGRAVGDEIW